MIGEEFKNRFSLRFIIYFAINALAVLGVWKVYNYALIGIDDANIYFVYMKNFALGNGFVYNPGGEKVEGFTSLLWTIIGGFIFVISSNPQKILFILNFIIVVSGLSYFLAKTDVWTHQKYPVSIHSVTIIAFLYFIPGYFDWSVVTLLDTGLWSVMLMLVVVNVVDFENSQLQQKRNLNLKLCFLLFLLPAVRPEAFLIAPLIGLIRIIQGKKGSLKSSSYNYLPILFLLFSFGALTVFRMIYFGYPLPNTFYAKVSSDKLSNLREGIRYFREYSFKWNYFFFVLAVQIILASVILGIRYVVIKEMTVRSKGGVWLCLISLVSLLLPLYSGGDHFHLGRFYQPLMPVMLVAFLYSFYLVGKRRHILYLSGAICMLCFIALNPVNILDEYKGRISDLQIEFTITESMEKKANTINDFFRYQKVLPSVGLEAAGSFAYHYQGVTIDLMGLNNVKMAHRSRVKIGLKNHSSFDQEVFLEQKPDLFLYSYFAGPDTTGKRYHRDAFRDWIYKGIMENQNFRQQYFPVFIQQKANGSFFHTWVSNHYLNKIDTNYYRIFHIDASEADKAVLNNEK